MRKAVKQRIITQFEKAPKPWSSYVDLPHLYRCKDGLPNTACSEGIRSLLCQMHEVSTYNQHIYIRKEKIQSPRDARSILRTQELISPLYLNGKASATPVSAYLKELLAFEKTAASKTGHADKYTILDSFTVMLPTDCSDLYYDDFINTLVKDTHGGKNLPHFATHWTQGKGDYITVYFSSRNYFPDGITATIKATSDTYRDARGRRCKADAEGAVLVARKGDIIRRTTTHFSLRKSDLFCMEYHVFKRTMERIKKHVAALIKDMGRAPAFILPRFTGESFRFRRMKKGVIRINAVLQKWEEKLNTIYENIKDIWDEKVINLFIANYLRRAYAVIFPIYGGRIGLGTRRALYLNFDYCSKWHEHSVEMLDFFLGQSLDRCMEHIQQKGASMMWG